MSPSLKLFSLEGKGLKLDTAADVEVHIKSLREMEGVEEVRLLGNTLGVEACKVLGEVLETKKSLKVRSYSLYLLRAVFNTNCPTGCEPGRYLHRTSAERNPPSALLTPHCAINPTKPPYHQPQ